MISFDGFLAARLAEDKAEAYPDACGCFDANHVPSCVPTPWLDRPRRELEARERLLADHPAAAHRCDWGEHRGGDFGPCLTQRIVAAVYSDHPDYRQEWAT